MTNPDIYKVHKHEGLEVEVILASEGEEAPPIYTIRMRYPLIIHAEIMTHRTFCLAGDAMLDFELPAGQRGTRRRRHAMSLREFADKWMNGSAEGTTSRHNGRTLQHIDPTRRYSAREIVAELGMSTATDLNAKCRDGSVNGAFKVEREWNALGSAWMSWRSETGSRRFDLRGRLSEMRIRQVNESTGEVVTSTVKDCVASGEKEVFRVSAGSFSVCGSKDHRILTSAGWKRIEEIIPGTDAVVTYSYGTGENADPNRHNKIGGRWVQTWARQNKKTVAERQGGICAASGQPLEEVFHLHHKEPRHLRPDLAFDLDNVIAVNPSAHTDLHDVQGWQTGVPLGTQATVVDAITSEGVCDTYDLEIAGEFPNFFADGVVVHNSRNARSARAVPFLTLMAELLSGAKMFVPWHWTKNQPGMQGVDGHDEMVTLLGDPDYPNSDLSFSREDAWRHAGESAIRYAKAYHDSEYHKQIVNRLVAPFVYIDVLITSTDWANFLWLRDHEDAEPHVRDLARLVAQAIKDAPVQGLTDGDWHLPYITQADRKSVTNYSKGKDDALEMLRRISAARCARISYAPFDGNASFEREMERFGQLVRSDRVHASPLEHQATSDRKMKLECFVLGEDGQRCGPSFVQEVWKGGDLSGNLTGYVQFRKLVSNEAVHG